MEKKEQTPEEKKETMMTGIFLVVSAVITYFFYKWIVMGFAVPLASAITGGFSLGVIGKIIIIAIIFIMLFGGMYAAYNKSMFYETNKYGMKSQDDSTSKIAKLKELKDKGAISEKEFEKKKKELLNKI